MSSMRGLVLTVVDKAPAPPRFAPALLVTAVLPLSS